MAQSNEPTIDQMNEAIAVFMGFEKVHVGFFRCKDGDPVNDETEWQVANDEWLDKMGIEDVGDFIVNVKEDKYHNWEDVNYHTSWDWMMPVVEKIRNLGYHIEITISVDCSVDIIKLRGDPSKDVLHIVAYSSAIDAVYTAIYQFITWYNQQKQKDGERNSV